MRWRETVSRILLSQEDVPCAPIELAEGTDVDGAPLDDTLETELGVDEEIIEFDIEDGDDWNEPTRPGISHTRLLELRNFRQKIRGDEDTLPVIEPE